MDSEKTIIMRTNEKLIGKSDLSIELSTKKELSFMNKLIKCSLEISVKKKK